MVLPCTHRLASRESIHLSELQDDPLILLSRNDDSILNGIIQQAYKEAGITPKYSSSLPQNTYDLALQILANKGVALTTSLMELSHIKGLSFCRIEEDIPNAEFVIAYQKEKMIPLLSAFLDVARETEFSVPIAIPEPL
ncbi:hypothetical protein SDC9_199550 [bioreactor metagenome]|uniref:LysR substrate-binding domain-containing protein n=1 Tax=bioreactor metagenome TaxID=1076179 RepID=A0A645INB3_9ZZZZ